MAGLKTKQTTSSVPEFIRAIADEGKRKDCETLLKQMKKATKEEPVLWGNGVIGFGKYHYKSERSKQEGDWFITGFSPRKQNLTVYIMSGFSMYADLMKKLGTYKTSGSCLYLNRLADVDEALLMELITRSFKFMKEKYK